MERYTGAGRDERRINLGTMRKKVRRLTQALTQRTGLRSAVSTHMDILIIYRITLDTRSKICN